MPPARSCAWRAGSSVRIAGRCHCGNIAYVLAWPDRAATLPGRRCGCSFCTRHGACWTAHPEARLEVGFADPGAVTAYCFGTRTATFHVCARCGVVALATSAIDGRDYAVVNANTFADGSPTLSVAPVSFEGEAAPDRLARRRRGWIAQVRIRATG